MGQTDDYKNYKALSQSSLKQLEYDTKSFYTYEERWLRGELSYKPEFRTTESMKLGEVVDCLLTTPNLFESSFTIITKAPTGQMLEFADEYIRLEKEATSNYTIEVPKETIQQLADSAYNYVGFKRDSLPKVLDRFTKEALIYYNTHRNAGNKTVLTSEMYAHAQVLVNCVKGDIHAGKYFKELPPIYEVFEQYAVYDEYFDSESDGELSVKLKGLLDRVIVNHQDKTVQGIDLKTTSEDFFPNAIVNYRYDLQGAFYNYLLSRVEAFNGYTILPFLFIAVNTKTAKVGVWKLSDSDVQVGMYGGKSYTGRYVKGFKQLLDDYFWHNINDYWECSRELHDNGGKRVTNCFIPNE
jgi:hypothetical protein